MAASFHVSHRKAVPLTRVLPMVWFCPTFSQFKRSLFQSVARVYPYKGMLKAGSWRIVIGVTGCWMDIIYVVSSKRKNNRPAVLFILDYCINCYAHNSSNIITIFFIFYDELLLTIHNCLHSDLLYIFYWMMEEETIT